MEFRILGPLEVFENGRQLKLGGAKQRTLLAVLLLHPNEVVSTDRLIEALWEEDVPDSGRKALQVYVSGLRKVLGKERLQTRAPGYLLRVEPDELDLGRFERLAASGRHDEALALWRGPPLQEFAYHRFAGGEIDRIDELRLVCLEDRIDVQLAEGRHASLVGELETLVHKNPLRERLRGQLMLALYRSGRQAEALEAHGGTLEVMTGDTMTAVVGLPVVHEDDPLRATRAAEEIQRRLTEGEGAGRLAVRIGVSTGPVFTGGEPTQHHVRAIGEPITASARLAQEAERGETVLDDATHKATAASQRVHGRFVSPMVGRDRELRRLRDAFEQAVVNDTCQLFTVLGAAGVGKSGSSVTSSKRSVQAHSSPVVAVSHMETESRSGRCSKQSRTWPSWTTRRPSRRTRLDS